MRETAEIKKSELKRIEFIRSRDGDEGAIAFIKRTYPVYRRAILDKRQFASLPGYKKEFIVSCIVFREFLAKL